MITVIYFLLLLAASAEDYRSHTVNSRWVFLLWVLGIIKIMLQKEGRWATVTLTCICFVGLWVVYVFVNHMAERWNTAWCFGGADVRMIPAMMLVQGWDVALAGVFLGMSAALVYTLGIQKKNDGIPLVPWMSMGCILVEIFYLFFGKSVL